MIKLKTIKIMVLVTLLLTVLAACDEKAPVKSRNSSEQEPAVTTKGQKPASIPQPKQAAPTTDVTLYFSNSQGEKLIREARPVPRTTAVAAAAIEQLIAGPALPSHYGVIPKGTRLIGISINDRVASVDFSREFTTGHTGGSAGETLTVYAVVNTLTEFSTIEAVRFLVEGKPIATIAGHFDLGEPVKRSERLIAPQ